MKFISLVFGSLLAGLGLYGLAVPSTFLSMAEYFKAAPGQPLYVASALRIAIGAVLIGTARRSRLPKAMYLFGGFIALVGLITAFAGNESAGKLSELGATYGSTMLRLWAVIAFAIGAVIVYATVPWKQKA